MGYVYAIMAPELKRVKIGRCDSEASFLSRFLHFQCGSPCELFIHSVVEHENYRLIEKRIHKRLKSARVHGEWFDITDPKVDRWLAHRESIEDPPWL